MLHHPKSDAFASALKAMPKSASAAEADCAVVLAINFLP